MSPAMRAATGTPTYCSARRRPGPASRRRCAARAARSMRRSTRSAAPSAPCWPPRSVECPDQTEWGPKRTCGEPPVRPENRRLLALVASLQAELVALGVVHDDPELAEFVLVDAHPGRALGGEAVGLGMDAAAALGQRRAPPADVDVEVDPVLGGLGLGDLLEVDPGSLAVGVDDRARGVPLAFGDTVLGRPLLPALVAVRRRLLLVAERGRPEGRQALGVGGVEGHLDRRGHWASLLSGTDAGTVPAGGDARSAAIPPVDPPR